MIKIKSLELHNYKSIVNTGVMNIHPNFTILAGRNNAGKTALIEALGLVFSTRILNENSVVSSLNDNFKLIIYVHLDNDNFEVHKIFGTKSSGNLRITFYKLNSVLVYDLLDEDYDFLLQIKKTSGVGLGAVITGGPNTTSFASVPEFYNKFFKKLSDRFVYISGTRVAREKETISYETKLDQTASNLTNFLFILYTNQPKTFKRVEDNFSLIFPDVELIQTPVTINTETQIKLKFEGSDTLIPLADCGSGYTHVLILLSILQADTNRIILYDEPHVYLHPAAEKAIYDLASKYSEHQFLLTTHSPILINYPVEKNLYLVKKEKGISTYSSLNRVGDILKELGIQNSDFSFAEKIIFVEGETEEKILPMIFEHFGVKQIGYNYKLLNMKGTGKEFNNKGAMSSNSQKIDLIMEGLSGNNPIPYIFFIDRDEKSDAKIQELFDIYGGKIRILQRREIENYFLSSSKQICKVLLDYGVDEQVTEEHVNTFISDELSKIDDRVLYPKERKNPELDVVGSRVLERLFEHYSLHYSKVIDGPRIVELILRENPEILKEIFDLFEDFLHK